MRTHLSRAAFAVVTASLLLVEIALTRVFSGTIGYYFAFMSISVAMLGLGAGSLFVTLRGALRVDPDVRAGRWALALGIVGALATFFYLTRYPLIGEKDPTGQIWQIAIFAALFLPFFVGGVIVSSMFEARSESFAALYAVDLLGAAIGCVVAVVLLRNVAAPKALFVVFAAVGLAAPMFLWAGRRRIEAAVAGALLLVTIVGGASTLNENDGELFALPVIRNSKVLGIAKDRWNDFSRVVVKWGLFCTWALSETYPPPDQPPELARTRLSPQFDLMVEGVAGTQIQRFDGDVKKLDYLAYDLASLPHWVHPHGSTLVLGVGGGFDVLMAKYFGKDPIVGVEVNPLVGQVVNDDFAGFSGRPYYQPGVTIHFENARTFVKRDTDRYDVVTVTWVDSGAATGAGAFALTENYLYTVDAFVDYLARLKGDGVLAFLRARFDPEYDTVKGIGIAVEALRRIGVERPEDDVVVTSVASPYFLRRDLALTMIKRVPFTAEELAKVDEVRKRLHFVDVYTPGRSGADVAVERLIRATDRRAAYASFPFDVEPMGDDRPFYFFQRTTSLGGPGKDVKVLVQSLVTIGALIAAFLVAPLFVLLRRRARAGARGSIARPTAYFALLGLGFMLVEMKLLQQSILVVGNPTLSLAAVLGALLLSTGVGALLSKKIVARGHEGRVFGALLCVLVVVLLGAEKLAQVLTAHGIVVRTTGLVLAIAPLGVLLGCPLPFGIERLRSAEKSAPGLVAWCWGVNGMLGVAGTAVAIYVAIHFGLTVSFLLGVGCYAIAAALHLVGAPAKAIAHDETWRAEFTPTAT